MCVTSTWFTMRRYSAWLQRGQYNVLWFILILLAVSQHSHCKVITKCNVDNSSTAGIICNNNEHISINAIFYYQSVGCSKTGSCYRSYRQGDVDFSPECQHVYGKCNQPLNHTVLDDCIPGNYNITVEVDYDCQVNQTIEGYSTVQVYGTSNKSWDEGISCPSQSYIYIESVAYWNLHNDSTCDTSTWRIPVIIPSEQIRLNNLCIKQSSCQAVLLNNVTTQDSCQRTWPSIGAEIKYRCIRNAIDVCTTIVRTNNDSLSTIYLTSPPKPNIQKVDSSCSCRIYGNKMDVRVLYLNISTINSTSGSLYITPPSTSLLNLTITLNTLLYSNISDLMVTYDDKNLYQQMLLDFKAINNDSFLQVNCTGPEHTSTTTLFTSATQSTSSTIKETNDEGEVSSTVIIAVSVGAGAALVIFIMIIQTVRLCIKRKSLVESNTESSAKSASPIYFELELEKGTNQTTNASIDQRRCITTPSSEDVQNNNPRYSVPYKQNSGVVLANAHALDNAKSVNVLQPNGSNISVNGIEIIETDLDAYESFESTNDATNRNLVHSLPSPGPSQVSRLSDLEILENDLYVPLELTQNWVLYKSTTSAPSDMEIMENDLYVPLEQTPDNDVHRFTDPIPSYTPSDMEILENDLYVPMEYTQDTVVDQSKDNNSYNASDLEIMENELYVPLELSQQYMDDHR